MTSRLSSRELRKRSSSVTGSGAIRELEDFVGGEHGDRPAVAVGSGMHVRCVCVVV